jgi:hypothetical protein
MRARASLGLCALIASFALLAEPARAQPVEAGDVDIQRARAMFARGEAAERAGRWADAIDALREVARIKSTAGVAFHIANCEEHLGQLTESLADFQLARALAEAEGAGDVRLLVAKRLEALDKRVPRLELAVDPADANATILVEGAAVARGRWDEPVRVNPGDREVVARIGDRDVFRIVVTLGEGGSARVHVDLRAALAAAAATPPAAAAPPAAPPKASPARPAPARRSDTRANGGSGVPGSALVAAGAAVLLAGGGVAAFVAAGSKNDSAREACASPATCDPGARDGVRALDGAALGMWIGAGVAAGLAVVLWTTASPSAKSGPRTSLVVGPSRLSLGGSF